MPVDRGSGDRMTETVAVGETTVPVDRGSGDRMTESVAVAAITDATSPANSIGSSHGAAVGAGKREGREWPPDDGVSFRDSGGYTIKGEGQRSEEQRRSNKKLLHEFCSIIVNLIL
jgi:hypothetical protein